MSEITIRVYGIWIDDQARVLISDERIGKFEFTKFPGGGLEHGEGTHETLHREWAEELNMPIEITRHLYTTDHCQWSAFKPDTQVISIYYRVEPQGQPGTAINTAKPTFSYEGEREEYFRWIPLDELKPEIMTFPIDKKVVSLLLAHY
jgi:ADP-ribose pyrophosphatase YjhB (NUDIX family)